MTVSMREDVIGRLVLGVYGATDPGAGLSLVDFVGLALHTHTHTHTGQFGPSHIIYTYIHTSV